MPSISIIVLARNVEDEILPALKTSQWANEVILVDTGSSDKTIQRARPHVTKVIKTSGRQNFAAWRNLGAKKATSDWLLYLDSDERIPKTLADEITATLAEPIHDAYTIPRYEIFLGKHLSHWPHPRVLRLIKKTSLIRWQGQLHEQPQIKGTIGKLKNQIVHLSHKNITEKLTNTLNWSRLEAKMLLKANHPPMRGWRFARILVTEFYTRAIRQRLWRDGTEGVIEIFYQMFSRFITYVRLWEMQRTPSLQDSYQEIDQKILDQWK